LTQQNPQGAKKFDYLKQLRHFLTEGKRGTLRIRTEYGPVELNISQGCFLTSSDDSAVIQTINMLIMCQVIDTSVEDLKTGQFSLVGKSPEEIIIRACYQGTPDETRVFELSRFFSLFPPVGIKLAPMYKVAEIFPGFTDYMKLHANSLLDGKVSLNDFLTRASSPDEMRSNVRLLVVLYVLGLIVPLPKPKRSVFNRLIKIVRGI